MQSCILWCQVFAHADEFFSVGLRGRDELGNPTAGDLAVSQTNYHYKVRNIFSYRQEDSCCRQSDWISVLLLLSNHSYSKYTELFGDFDNILWCLYILYNYYTILN